MARRLSEALPLVSAMLHSCSRASVWNVSPYRGDMFEGSFIHRRCGKVGSCMSGRECHPDKQVQVLLKLSVEKTGGD